MVEIAMVEAFSDLIDSQDLTNQLDSLSVKSGKASNRTYLDDFL